MNAISAELRPAQYSAEPYLHIVIDGQPLDELLHHYYPTENFLGLIPTLLGCLDNPSERQVVWERATRQTTAATLLPILMCPDDCDLVCTVIIAQVMRHGDVVRWERLGRDATTSLNPNDCGGTVEWLPRILPFAFARDEYQRCLHTFAAALNEPA